MTEDTITALAVLGAAAQALVSGLIVVGGAVAVGLRGALRAVQRLRVVGGLRRRRDRD